MSKTVHRRISPKQETAANVYNLPSIARVIKYLHVASGFPTKDTWLKAIVKGNYASWPGIAKANVKKHYPESVETQKVSTAERAMNKN